MEQSGELEAINEQWMSKAAGAPNCTDLTATAAIADRRLEREAAKLRKRTARPGDRRTSPRSIVIGGLARPGS